MRTHFRIRAHIITLALAAIGAGCGEDASKLSRTDETYGPGNGVGGTGGNPGARADAGFASDAGGGGGATGSFGNVGVSGGQDFAAFRKALDDNRIPAPQSLEATGFFAEHYNALPAPTCGRTFCLHGMLSVSQDFVRGGEMTLLQMAMNSPIDPATIEKPPLNLVVVLDHSGSMASDGKMLYAKEGVQLLVDALGERDTFTLVVFDSEVKTLFGPARVTDKAALKGIVGEIQPQGGTNIYSGLEAGYKAALSTSDDSEQRRVIFLTDGIPTAGTTDAGQIRAMSVGYNKKYVGLTTIGLGSDVNISLLRGLAESGGGNFYYIEKAQAVTEVFTEELAFFVAPIAYDLELSFSELPGYTLKAVHGTALWQPEMGGGKLNVPSVFLVSRTSTEPGPGGGRRGGGSAMMAELAPSAIAQARPHPVGRLRLKYRLPGSQTFEVQETDVVYPAAMPGTPETPEYFSVPAVEKNTLILGFYFAFRDATMKAQTDPGAARALLTAFETKMIARLEGVTDEDLLDDLKILRQYISLLERVTAGPR